jgi:lysophospholipase
LSEAPLHPLAEGPPGGFARWVRSLDGVRLRAAIWPQGDRGTVLLFPGRTEYVEKYGRAAADLAARGYASVAIDWRGQGLSDRALADPLTGHVGDFAEYQLDIQAMLGLAASAGLPQPLYLLSHSMGGCIALRALHRGLEVRAAAFCAPMWGLRLKPATRIVAQQLAAMSRLFQQSHRYAPGTSRFSYMTDAGFEGNVLTTDPEMFAWMKAQVAAVPELGLAGPSLGWLHAALVECRTLAARRSPALPAFCAVGSAERVVDPAAIHSRMADWPGGTLSVVQEAEHEILMETPAIRRGFIDSATALFGANR